MTVPTMQLHIRRCQHTGHCLTPTFLSINFAELRDVFPMACVVDNVLKIITCSGRSTVFCF